MIQVGDVLSGRTLNFSFPNGMTFAESGTVFSSDNYSVEMVYDETTDGNDVTTITMTVVLNDSGSTLIETFYSANTVSGTTTTTVNLTTYTLPTSFGVCSSIDDTVVAYQYIVAVMGTPLCSDTLNMASYQTTHDEAAKVATNYLHYDVTNGLVISENASQDIATITGGNTRITNDGMTIYDGTTQIANFSTSIEIGPGDGSRLYLDADTISMTNTSGYEFFSADMGGEEESTWVVRQVLKTGAITGMSGSTHSVTNAMVYPFTIPSGTTIKYDFTASFFNGSTYVGADKISINFTKNTSSTVTEVGSLSNITYTFVYDGDLTVTISGLISYDPTYWSANGTVGFTTTTPSFTLGTRESTTKGKFSTTIGEMLSAESDHQIAIGKYNIPVDGSKYSIVIGNGYYGHDSNSCVISRFGNPHCRSIDRGVLEDTYIEANSYEDYEIIFTHGMISAPIVVATFQSTSTAPAFGKCTLSVHSVTNNKFTIRIFNGESSDSRSPNVNWIAITPEDDTGLLGDIANNE